MLNKLQDWINGESFRELNRRRRSRRGIRENFHRLSGPGPHFSQPLVVAV